LHHFEFKAFCPEFEWYVMNSVFSWKGTIQSVFMVLPPPGVARQGFVTSTIWQEICSRKDRPIFSLLSNEAIPKMNFLVSGRIFVVTSIFSVFGLSYGRSGNEICSEEGQNPIFDPLPRNEKLCGNL